MGSVKIRKLAYFEIVYKLDENVFLQEKSCESARHCMFGIRGEYKRRKFELSGILGF